MSQAKTMHGARAKLGIMDPVTGDVRIVGLFSNVSYGVAYDMQPIYTLGRFSPAEIVPTGQEAVSVTATGFRIVDNGPHVAAKVPKLQDLLNHEDLSLALIDRQTGKQIMTVFNVRPTGYQTTVGARGVQEITVNFIGIKIEDESGDQEETPGATSIIDGS